MMRRPDPAVMTPEERRSEVAQILSAAHRRICRKSSQYSLADRPPAERSCEPVNTHETRREIA